MLPNAIKRVKSALLIREIAVEEKIEVSEKELDDKINELKKQYEGNEQVQKMVSEHNYRHYLKNVMSNEKVLNKLKEWNYASSGAKQKS